MNLLIVAGYTLGGGIFFLFLVYNFWSRSYRHKALIALQTGDSPGDVVWTQDRFKVVRQDKYYVLLFKRAFKNRTPSPPFKYWTRFLRRPDLLNEGAVRLTEKEMRKNLTRGMVFYQTSEGELRPVVLSSPGELSVLSQDNRAFIADDIERQKKMIETSRDKLIQAGVFVGVAFISAMILIFAIVYFNQIMTNNIAAVCSGATQAAKNNAASGVTGFIQDVVGG